MYAFEDLRDAGVEFDRFRVIQETDSDLTVEVQVSETPDPDLESAILQALSGELAGMRITIRISEKLQLSRSGKLRIVENRVARDGE